MSKALQFLLLLTEGWQCFNASKHLFLITNCTALKMTRSTRESPKKPRFFCHITNQQNIYVNLKSASFHVSYLRSIKQPGMKK